jgi:NAD dependent epimerase/dehydratase family enzyme
MGELAETLLVGQRAMPKRLEDIGHKFIHSEVRHALQDLLT